MKHALVVGGSGGIGAGIVGVLAREGWRATVTGATQAKVEAFARTHADAAVTVLDVTDDAAVGALFAEIDRLDALVNCAGILRRGVEYDIASFARVIDVNLTGTMRTCLAAHDLLAAAHGAIVNTASMLSMFGGPLVPAYSASKGGVVQLTKALAG